MYTGGAAEGSVLEKRGSPKINGSVGGFIGLVVALVVVIIVACTAVFFLLREEAPSGQPRSRNYDQDEGPAKPSYSVSVPPAPWYSRLGRIFGQRGDLNHGTRVHPRSRNYEQDADLAKPSYGATASVLPAPWYSRLSRILGRRGDLNHSTRTQTNRMKMGRPTPEAGGWVQTGSRDDWDPEVSGSGSRYTCPGGLMPVPEISEQGPPLTYPTPLETSFRTPPISYATSESGSSVRFDLHGIKGMAYRDRQSPSPQSSLPTVHSWLNSPASSSAPSPLPARTTSPEPMQSLCSDISADREPERPAHSGSSMRTFEGGTKFIEGF
ncbi:hypothetical protein BD779DRAFT_1797741 [Infundibulicybe gibba]|nr:hypothetical protein BD779DRAFT_1797741 [Infundibulicybe gibba]